MSETTIEKFSIISNSKVRRVSGEIDGKKFKTECTADKTIPECKAALLAVASGTASTKKSN